MSGHSFGARLFVLREHILGWSRRHLAEQLRRYARALPTDDAGGLLEVSAEDIRRWEKDTVEPSFVTKKVISQVLGFPHDLLDPEGSNGSLSPQGLIQLGRAGGVSPEDIRYYWTETKRRARFSGNPGIGEWIQIIGILAQGRQGQLPLRGRWCTHCGDWVPAEAIVCLTCGVPD